MDRCMVDRYLAILKEELLPAMGCTEPIAVAYAAAYMAKVLEKRPERIEVAVSGNILKNVKSVVVPNTDSLTGLPAAVAAGAAAGNADKKLEVLADIRPEQEPEIRAFMEQCPIEVTCSDTPRQLDIVVSGFAGEDSATVHIANNHTNVVRVEKNTKILFQMPLTDDAESNLEDKSILSVEGIVDFVDTVSAEELEELIGRQIDYNTAIAAEGLKNSWGANIGSTTLSLDQSITSEVCAWAAAGSDARMSGCEMPVVIVSGSGNQGITASVPVARYAAYKGADRATTLRAVALSDLITIHQKTGIGRLSAYCGAVSAGCGAGCGIAWLNGERAEGISHTIINCIATTSGIVCDGAKPSCAAKIATAVRAGMTGYAMYTSDNNFKSGDGIVGDGVEETIRNVGILAREGMAQTDRTILGIMVKN